MLGVNSLFKSRFTNLIKLLFPVLLLPCQQTFAEGSKDLYPSGASGYRAYLSSSTAVNNAIPFPTLGTMKVYVRAGETINVGSSAQGIHSGTINLRGPGGVTFTSGTGSAGLIANRTQELNGPNGSIYSGVLVTNGYTPYPHVVAANEAGIWEIDFLPTDNSSEQPPVILANGNWVQPTSSCIAAFDITVTDATNNVQRGRVYTNVFSGIMGSPPPAGFSGSFYVQTQDGYQYKLDNQSLQGGDFSFFANNKGFRKGDGTPSYQSVDDITKPNIQDPRAADTQSDVTEKIFFYIPDSSMPAVSPTPNGTTWLNTQLVPGDFNPIFTGIEGTPGKAGTAPLGGKFSFNSTKAGTYKLTIDGTDLDLEGDVVIGANTITWNGLDGSNNLLPASTTPYNAKISVTFKGGEVHFPYFDVESNAVGMKLTNITGGISTPSNVAWDDSPIQGPGVASNPPTTPATGVPSTTNGHMWGTNTGDLYDFGNNKGLDTWSFISDITLTKNTSALLQQADLEVTSIVPSTGSGCIGQDVSYTFTVNNNGPSDVVGAKVNFTFPTTLTDVVVKSSSAGASSLSNETTTATAYNGTLDIANGAVLTYTVTGKSSPTLSGGTIDVTASILRPADVTDFDATDPDGTQPTDPQKECDASPSGTGCNNIKTNSVAFLALPSIGQDKTIIQNETVTLSDANDGVWTQQVPLTPVVVNIAAPTAKTTDITGFTDIGTYQIIRTNANSCADTITINVVPKNIDIPTVFTPNGDGKNDTFTIPNINLFPGSQLLIFNRWGNEVYHSDNYTNTWDGTGLSEGTYYYVLNKKEASGNFTTFKGWIYLKR